MPNDVCNLKLEIDSIAIQGISIIPIRDIFKSYQNILHPAQDIRKASTDILNPFKDTCTIHL